MEEGSGKKEQKGGREGEKQGRKRIRVNNHMQQLT